LLLIAHALVDNPGQLAIEANQEGVFVTLRLHCSNADIGKIIGKQGRTARSIRTVISGAAIKLGIRCSLDIVEPKHPTDEGGVVANC
jgi:predicted RNA-binding protein YlqC (UPF0109 family)